MRSTLIPVTTAARTLVDSVQSAPLSSWRWPSTTRLHRSLVTYASLFGLIDRIGKQGRNGIGVLRQILRDRDLTHRPTESAKETELLRLIRASGLPLPTPQVEIRDRRRFVARVDFAYPDAMLVLEYDSDSHHTGAINVRRDNRRRNLIVEAGWTVLVATQHDLRSGGHDIIRAVRTHLDRSGVSWSRHSATN